MAEKKFLPFIVLQILEELSDESHILSTNELIDHIERRSGISIERRTLYSNIEILEQAGYIISKFADNGKGYYLEKRQFSKGEVLLLCNAIHASHFISSKQSNALITSLLKTLNKYDQKDYHDAVYMPNMQKTSNDLLFDNIAKLSEAIQKKKVIQFVYMHYDSNKKLVPKRETLYTVEPRFIVYQDSRPYLITTSKTHPGFAHYRIDKICKLSITTEKVNPFMKESEQDAYHYAKNKLFMYSSEQIHVRLQCGNRIMDQMIDIFGTEMKILKRDEESFIASVLVNKQGILFLAQQFMEAIEIIEPDDLRKTMKEQLKLTLKKYSR